jgi:transcriptional regulator with XRE-family HTH domain
MSTMIAAPEFVPLDCEKIKRLRERLGLSMADAAEKAGFSAGRQAWYNIESGQRTNIKIETLERIAKALGVKAADLLR